MRLDAEKSLQAYMRWAATEAAKPWREWFAWYPVQDWFTGDWFWLETVRYRLDFQTARYFYKPLRTKSQPL